MNALYQLTNDSHENAPERANTQIVCLMTRFEVRSLRGMLRLYRSFRKVREASRQQPGLIATRFLLESTHTCYTVSFWKNEAAIWQFNTDCVEHIEAANRCFRDLRRSNGKVCLWSARFRLSALSDFNANWLAGAWTRTARDRSAA
jgi:hypothetical protein